jgi:hypothetical protein
LNQGRSYLSELLKDNDVICVQEHWLSVDDLSKLYDMSDGFVLHCSSAMNEVLGRGILKGRPYGGVAIFI